MSGGGYTRPDEFGDAYQELINGGPQPLEVRISPQMKEDGVRRFSLSTTTAGELSLGRNPLSVYYIDGRHSPTQVLRRYFEENPHIREENDDHVICYAVTYQYSDEWKAAADELLDAEYPTTGQTPHNAGETMGGTCPLCGDEYVGHLRSHLPCNGGDADE